MLTDKLNRDQSLAGRSIEMTVSATGQIVDAYDLYIDIYGHVKGHTCMDDPQYQEFERQIFVRLIFWETTHKQIVIGTVTVLDGKDLPKEAIEDLERASVPLEKKDYWKKMFEKYVVVEFSKILSLSPSLDQIHRMWSVENHRDGEPMKTCNIDIFSVHSCPITSYEFVKRNMRLVDGAMVCCASEGYAIVDGDGEPLKSKCWEGPRGFVRSDTADGFELKPISLPVTMSIK